MFKRGLIATDYLLILVNLVPLYGVWFEGWDARMVFLVYCLETIIIGIMTILKMAALTLFVKTEEKWKINGKSSRQTGWFLILFFTLHYGIFVFVQTQLFFGVSGLMKGTSMMSGYAQIPALLGNEGKILLAIFICYYTLETIFNFFLSGEYKRISLAKLIFQHGLSQPAGFGHLLRGCPGRDRGLALWAQDGRGSGDLRGGPFYCQ